MKNIFTLFIHPRRLYRTIRGRFDERWAIEQLWFSHMGYKINLDSPRTLNEKLQWLKLHDHNPLYTTLVDKYTVKAWFAENFGNEYIIPTIALYKSSDDIVLEDLPQKFVLKCNHDSGSVILCDDKNKFDLEDAKKRLAKALENDWYLAGREWCYKNIKNRYIMVEPYLTDSNGKIPNDYKLHFINGKLAFIYVSYDRKGVNDRCVYDEKWNRLPFAWVLKSSYRENMNTSDVPCPKTLSKMVELGNKIASIFKYVRVDFYDVDGKLYFGEITLYHGSGYDTFFPKEYDEYFGNMLQL